MTLLTSVRQKEAILPQSPDPTPHSLAQAFSAFKDAAQSLEDSYAQLQMEIGGLRRELKERNRDLAQSLQENERIRAYLVRILEGLPCGVLVCNASGKLQVANPAARRLLAAAGCRVKSSADRGGLTETLADLPERIRSIESGMEHCWPVENSDSGLHLAVTRALLPGPEGTSGDWVFILRDVTHERRLEIEKDNAGRVQALAEMSAVLAHEIRNPLASLELFAGLLAGGTAGETERRRWADHLQAGLRALGATVNNVLHFHGQPSPQRVNVNLRVLLRETVDFLGPLARQGGMKIELVERPEDGPKEIYLQADPHRLQQVFLNLALNSFRVMPTGGVVTVFARQMGGEGGRIEILFADQGPGIDPSKIARIFEPRYSTNPGSPGLGLAVSKKIVEQHGGKITAESAAGRGAVFHLEFPVAGAEK